MAFRPKSFAAVRAWEAFHYNSQTKPQVVVDPELGYVFGNKALRLITDFRGFASTHGSMHGGQSRGVFVSTARQLPSIRPDDFRKYVEVKDFGKRTTYNESRVPSAQP